MKKYVLVNNKEYDLKGVYYGGLNPEYSDIFMITTKKCAKKFNSVEEANIEKEILSRRFHYSEYEVEEFPILTLPIKKKWFDMILDGIKLEEYREIKDYWTKRFKKIGLLDEDGIPIPAGATVLFQNGYSAKSPAFLAYVSLDIKTGNPEWGAEEGVLYYTLKVHEIKETFNI